MQIDSPAAHTVRRGAASLAPPGAPGIGDAPMPSPHSNYRISLPSAASFSPCRPSSSPFVSFMVCSFRNMAISSLSFRVCPSISTAPRPRGGFCALRAFHMFRGKTLFDHKARVEKPYIRRSEYGIVTVVHKLLAQLSYQIGGRPFPLFAKFEEDALLKRHDTPAGWRSLLAAPPHHPAHRRCGRPAAASACRKTMAPRPPSSISCRGKQVRDRVNPRRTKMGAASAQGSGRNFRPLLHQAAEGASTGQRRESFAVNCHAEVSTSCQGHGRPAACAAPAPTMAGRLA